MHHCCLPIFWSKILITELRCFQKNTAWYPHSWYYNSIIVRHLLIYTLRVHNAGNFWCLYKISKHKEIKFLNWNFYNVVIFVIILVFGAASSLSLAWGNETKWSMTIGLCCSLHFSDKFNDFHLIKVAIIYFTHSWCICTELEQCFYRNFITRCTQHIYIAHISSHATI